MVKIDPYNTKEKYMTWKNQALENGITGLTKPNSQIIIQYLQDMERGANIANGSVKGSRSYNR